MRAKIKQKEDKTSQTNTINQLNLKSLKQIDTTNEDEQQQTNKFQFAMVNTRSIKPKQDIILEALNEYKIDLLVTMETWVKKLKMTSNGYNDQK